MILFMFFVNKPITLIPFIGALAFCLILSLIEVNSFMFLLPFLLFSLPFIAWYQAYLLYHYLIDVEDTNEFEGINLSEIKSVRYFFYIGWFGVAFSALSYLYISHIVVPAIVWFAYSIIVIKIMEGYAMAKITSEAIRQNIDIREISIQNFYSSARQLLMKRLID